MQILIKADSYKDLSRKQIYRQHVNEKKRMYANRVMEVEQATFTPLVFTTTGGMAEECRRYHSRLAELLADKKGEEYATTISWIRAKVSFEILRSAPSMPWRIAGNKDSLHELTKH